MSVDLSDPEIARVKDQVLDTTNPTSWFLLHYSPSATSPTLSPVSSGQDPIVQQWTEALNKLKGEGDEVAFGYGEFKGKGCVLHYLTDKTGGVKRARAVVHSRAFASLFPDYSALITISDPSQLTQELINEKLGLNYHVQQVTSGTPTHTPHEERKEPSWVPSLKREDEILPPTPQATAPVAQNDGPLNGHGHERAAESLPSTQSHPPAPSHTVPPVHAAHEPSSVPIPQQSRNVSGSGPAGNTASTPTTDRHRKVSLTARLGKAFGNPSNQSQSSTASHSPGGSPGSPSSTSKFKSSFTKAFRRTSAEPAQPDTRTDSPDAPPVPPKDEQLPRQAQSSTNGHVHPPAPGAYRTPSGGVGYSQSPVLLSPRSDSLPSNPQPLRTNGTFSPGSANHSNAATINHSSPQDTHLSPSPSAQRVFSEARIKSLTQEEEIQARFRRDLYVNDSGPSSQAAGAGAMEAADDQEEDLRLPYDMSDDGHSDHVADEEQNSKVDDIPQALQLGKPVGTRTEGGRVLYYDQDRPSQNTGDVLESDVVDTEEEARRAEDEIKLEDARISKEQENRSEDLEFAQRQGEEDRHREVEDARRAEEVESIRLREEEEQRARQAELDERRRVEGEEEERLRMQEAENERIRSEEEETLRIRAIEDERNRLEEEERLAVETEAKCVQEEEDARRKEEEDEQLRIAQEEQRLIEEARLREEEDKLRIALEEQRRIEEARLREEETRRQEEEERRIEAEKQEAERVRKENIKQSLREGKTNGGVMLRGHVTVQTTKSLIWRRRYFQLLSGEMRLYKAESDEKPIQVVHLGSRAKIEHTYEESQAQGSWKIVSDGSEGQEEFFVYADSPEEKETILEGLQIAIQ